jgi:uncharacterized coiled-coil protein SlyX
MTEELMEEQSSGGAKQAWENLTDRERKLVTLMVCNFLFLGLAGSIYFFNKSLAETEDEIARYEKTLDALTEYGPRYLERQAREEGGAKDEDERRFTAELLKKNKLQLTSFVATQASAVDIKVDNYDEDSLKLSTKDSSGPIITEQQLRVDIREAEMEKMLKLLDRIEKSKEPVVIKRINLRDVRNKKGFVRANITISTYTMKEQES